MRFLFLIITLAFSFAVTPLGANEAENREEIRQLKQELCEQKGDCKAEDVLKQEAQKEQTPPVPLLREYEEGGTLFKALVITVTIILSISLFIMGAAILGKILGAEAVAALFSLLLPASLVFLIAWGIVSCSAPAPKSQETLLKEQQIKELQGIRQEIKELRKARENQANEHTD
jgi:hypothetical protein